MPGSDDLVARLRRLYHINTGRTFLAGEAVNADGPEAADEIERLMKERDEARQIVRDIYWMALRYADGRKTYASWMANEAVKKGYSAGWLDPNKPLHQETPMFARDGDGPEWESIEARAEAAEASAAAATRERAEVERLRALLEPFAGVIIGGAVADDPVNREKYPLLTQHIINARAALHPEGAKDGQS